METRLLALLLLIALALNSLTAAQLETKLLKYCDKVQSCALNQIESQDIPEQYHSMLRSQMKGMCDGVQLQFKDYAENPKLANAAASCIDSLNQQSCEQLMSSNNETKECKAFNRLAGD